jgi:hypothetical protein
MPSYFCSTCHTLITLEFQLNPNAVVCEACKKKSSAVTKEDVGQSEAQGDAHPTICNISDWK